MTFYTTSKLQDLAKSMLEDQTRIEKDLMSIFSLSKNQETIFRSQDLGYLLVRASLCRQFSETEKCSDH